MQQTFTGYVRARRANGLRAGALRFILTLAFALILPASALAYTVVLRSGRRVEIPSTFSATRTTLTYQYAPGIYVTLQMSTIDIAATDRANNEPSGSFLKRTMDQQQGSISLPHGNASVSKETGPRRTVTDRDLEASRRARQQSEEAYERRRIELGLPSRAESEARREEESRWAREQLRLSEEDGAQSESYWRTRASQLRAEIAAADGEINYLRARLAETPDPFSSGSYTVLSTIAPIVPFHQGLFPRAFPASPVLRPHFGSFNRGITAPGAQLTGRIPFGGGSTRGQVLINPRGTVSPFGTQLAATAFGLRRGLSQPFFPLPLTTVVGTSFPYQYYSYEREALVARLDELAAHRAGLQARWRVLEDEARRAGALPGWLR